MLSSFYTYSRKGVALSRAGILSVLFTAGLWLQACGNSAERANQDAAKPPTQQQSEIIVGAERMDQIRPLLDGKTAGLIVNQSSLVGETHLIDVLQADSIALGALFAVEHGVRGNADAGAIIEDGKDVRSGLPVISIYGSKKGPSKDDLIGLDILVYDLQDVGVRFYTYLSSLHYVMESCAKYDVPLVVLDRPNPNIAFIDGPILETEYQSFVGMHPVPLLHGMTLGELGRMINGEGWLGGGLKCDLTIIPVENYTRSSEYTLPVRPSPNLPTQEAIMNYPSLGLFEASDISVGRGTDFPFQVLGGTHPGFGDFTFTPHPVIGEASNPKHNGKTLYGQDLRGKGINGLQIEYFINWYQKALTLEADFITRPEWLAKLTGTDSFRTQVEAGKSAQEIRQSWAAGLTEFKTRRAPYLIYADGPN